MQTFQLIFSDMSFVSNQVRMFCISLLLSPCSCDFNLQKKSNYVNFDAEKEV